MVQQSDRHEVPTHGVCADSDHQVLLFPTRFAAYVPTDLPARSTSRPTTTPRGWVWTRAISQVIVLGVAGQLSDVLEDLDRAMQLALADEEARGVVCDLSAVLEGVEPVAVEVLATAGRHVRDWPGIPVGVVCPHPQVREALGAHTLGAHLIVTESLFSAISAVLALPTLTPKRLRLAPHPTAPRAARDFVTRALLGWQLNELAPIASLVVSELVTRSSFEAGTDIDLSVVWNLGALRLTVRDHGPRLPGQRHSDPDLHEQGLTLVAGLSRAFGILPTADGGKVVWAVLDAPRPPPPISSHQPAADSQESLALNQSGPLTEPNASQIIERSDP
jgi:hypothetical protein